MMNSSYFCPRYRFLCVIILLGILSRVYRLIATRTTLATLTGTCILALEAIVVTILVNQTVLNKITYRRTSSLQL